MAPRAPDARQLSDLLDLSQTLGATLNLRQALQRVLAILEESRGTLSGTIVLRDDSASDLVVEAARLPRPLTRTGNSPRLTVNSSQSTVNRSP